MNTLILVRGTLEIPYMKEATGYVYQELYFKSTFYIENIKKTNITLNFK